MVLHGLATPHMQLWPVRRALKRAGFAVRYVAYPSTRYGIAGLARRYVKPAVEAAAREGAGAVHFVGYSMGGVVLRQYLAREAPPGLRAGRMVHIASPNHGTEIVDALREVPGFRWYYGQAGLELAADAGGITHGLPEEPGVETLVIAGNRSLNPLGSWIFRRAHDGTVPVESARLEGAAFKVVAAPHPLIQRRGETLEAMVRFLNGSG